MELSAVQQQIMTWSSCMWPPKGNQTHHTIETRCFKHFNAEAFITDLKLCPWSSIEIYDDIDDSLAHWKELWPNFTFPHQFISWQFFSCREPYDDLCNNLKARTYVNSFLLVTLFIKLIEHAQWIHFIVTDVTEYFYNFVYMGCYCCIRKGGGAVVQEGGGQNIISF